MNDTWIVQTIISQQPIQTLCTSNLMLVAKTKLLAEPYQPHSIPPNWGGHAVTGGPKFQSRNNLAPQRKLRSPKLKYEAWEISKVGAPFQRNVHYSFFGPLWKQGIYTLQLLLGGHIESKVVHLYIAIAVGPLWKKGIYTLQLLLGGLLKAK